MLRCGVYLGFCAVQSWLLLSFWLVRLGCGRVLRLFSFTPHGSKGCWGPEGPAHCPVRCHRCPHYLAKNCGCLALSSCCGKLSCCRNDSSAHTKTQYLLCRWVARCSFQTRWTDPYHMDTFRRAICCSRAYIGTGHLDSPFKGCFHRYDESVALRFITQQMSTGLHSSVLMQVLYFPSCTLSGVTTV